VALDPIEITGGLAIGTGLGGAIEDTVRPRLESFRQSQWKAHPDVALQPGAAAEVAAEDFASFQAMVDEAARNGYNSARFQHLYDITVTAPGMGELLNVLRRGTINPGNFTHGLRKARLEPMWDNALADLANQKLSAPDIAYMVVRGVLPDDGMLGQTLPTHADNLNLPPQLALDPVAEAALTGWDKERLRAFIGRSGLAMAPVMAAQARFRKILTQNDYELTIARGDLYPAYADPVLQASRQIPSAGEAVQYQLRGFTDAAGRRALTELHGMTDAHSDILYDVAGRAPSDRQVYIGLARGAKYPATYADVPEPFRAAIQRSDIRPEFADIVYQNRYSLPSAFVVRSLLTDGAIDEARGSTILQHEGWPQDLADLVANHYGGKTAAVKPDPHVTKAQGQLYTEAHKAYVKVGLDRAQVTPALNALAVPAAAQAEVFTLWDMEKQLAAEAPPA
jgi:hypothetical protein